MWSAIGGQEKAQEVNKEIAGNDKALKELNLDGYKNKKEVEAIIGGAGARVQR